MTVDKWLQGLDIFGIRAGLMPPRWAVLPGIPPSHSGATGRRSVPAVTFTGGRWAAQGFFRHVPDEGSAKYLLAKRSSAVDDPGKWGVPGGAMRQGEPPEAAARRETQEEIGVLPSYMLTGEEEQGCGGGWAFHLLHAEVTEAFRDLGRAASRFHGLVRRTQMSSLPLHLGINRWLAGLGVN